MIKIEVADMQEVMKVKPSAIRNVLKSVLKQEDVCNAEISVALVDNEQIIELNERYLDTAEPTDVLSFLLEEDFDGQGTMLCDIIASCEMAKQQAHRYAISPQAEVMQYLVHGLLHVLGYDDNTRKKRNQMNKLQRAVLHDFGYQLEK